MYLLQDARGTGITADLLQTAITFVEQQYRACYLETLQTMQSANRFYSKHDFRKLEAPLAGSEHFASDAGYNRYLVDAEQLESVRS
nr:GNAT family N-acetyltransferase [Fontibacillus phaseoli]